MYICTYAPPAGGARLLAEESPSPDFRETPSRMD